MGTKTRKECFLFLPIGDITPTGSYWKCDRYTRRACGHTTEFFSEWPWYSYRKTKFGVTRFVLPNLSEATDRKTSAQLRLGRMMMYSCPESPGCNIHEIKGPLLGNTGSKSWMTVAGPCRDSTLTIRHSGIFGLSISIRPRNKSLLAGCSQSRVRHFSFTSK